jgi:hypothetical protein
VSVFDFILVRDGQPVRRCATSDIELARYVLNPQAKKGEWVVSAASLALGMRKPLASDMCRGCGVRPRGDKSDLCTPCKRLRRNERDAERTGSGKGGPGRARTAEHRASIAAGMRRTWAGKRGAA